MRNNIKGQILTSIRYMVVKTVDKQPGDQEFYDYIEIPNYGSALSKGYAKESDALKEFIGYLVSYTTMIERIENGEDVATVASEGLGISREEYQKMKKTKQETNFIISDPVKKKILN